MDRKYNLVQKFRWLSAGFDKKPGSPDLGFDTSMNSILEEIKTDDDWLRSFEKKYNKKPTDATCKIYQCNKEKYEDFLGNEMPQNTNVSDVDDLSFEKWLAEYKISDQDSWNDTLPPISYRRVGTDMSIDLVECLSELPILNETISENGDDLSLPDLKGQIERTDFANALKDPKNVPTGTWEKKKPDKYAHIMSPVAVYIRGGGLKSFTSLNEKRTKELLFENFDSNSPAVEENSSDSQA